ncbi:lyase [Streptomyces albus subsp. albus]|nr:lyase [Streptomyces albus subsp. albus]
MPRAWPRRRFTATTGALGLGLAVGAGPAGPGHPAHAAEPAADDPYGRLRQRWRDLALGTGYDPAAEPYAGRLRQLGAQAAAHRAAMRPAAGSLWPDQPYDPPSGITQSYARLAAMAQAYAQPGTGLTGDPELAADLARGLDHLDRTVYHPGTTRYGNWWEWQIGSPRLLLDTLTLGHDRIPAELRERALAAVDHFVPDAMLGDYSGTSTGANRVDLCRVVALRGILGAAPGKIALARDALSPVFPYVTAGDGLYADGSFIQHTQVAYTGTYGQVLLDGLARLLHLLAGSPWEITDPARRIIHDSVEHAFAPLIVGGLVMDGVSGRAISRGIQRGDTGRPTQSDHQRGHQLIAALALLAESTDAAARERTHALVKSWIQADTHSPVLTDPRLGVAELARLHAIAAGPVPAAAEPVEHRLFTAMDRAVHRRPGWTAGLAMASNRITYYENGNGENPRGWHTGAGMLSWWAGPGTLGTYSDAFWPTADPYRLPGTTVSAKPLADNEGGSWGEPKPAARWVGGTTDGEFAAVGQELHGLSSTLRARTSWFFLADAVVCLGAGITARDGTGVHTTVEHRNLGAGGTAALTVDGAVRPAAPGWGTTFPDAHWAHLEGHGGYVFPGGTRLAARYEDRTGAWRDINAGGDPAPLTRRYLTLWQDHGTDPDGAAYRYLLMPGADRRAVAARAADQHWLTVLDNDERRQGVRIASLGVTAVVFWQPGGCGGLTVSGPAGVLLRRDGRRATLCVADPARTGTALELSWDRPVRAVTSADPAIEVLGTGRALRLRITAGTAGATHRCVLDLGGGGEPR